MIHKSPRQIANFKAMLYTSHGTFKVKFVCATKGEGGGHGG